MVDEYSINRGCDKFFIKRGDNRILKQYGHCGTVTDATLYDPCFCWMEIKPFNSFIQAVRFLKENINNLL
jgi:hypothetical protein